MLCVILCLCNDDIEKLAAVRGTAFPENAGLKPLHGHITVAAYTGEDEERFVRSCIELLEGLASFDVEYKKIEVLNETSIIVASPEKTGVLDTIHKLIAERFNEDLDEWTKTDVWYPHTTLYYDPEADLTALCGKMKKVFAPFKAHICRIEFSRVLERGYEIISGIELV